MTPDEKKKQLSEFTTFAQSQGAKWLGSAEDVWADAKKNAEIWTKLIGPATGARLMLESETRGVRIGYRDGEFFRRKQGVTFDGSSFRLEGS